MPGHIDGFHSALRESLRRLARGDATAYDVCRLRCDQPIDGLERYGVELRRQRRPTVATCTYFSLSTLRLAPRVEGDPVPVRDGVFYMDADHLGSASLTTDSSGHVVGEESYYPFGVVCWVSGTLQTDLTFYWKRSERTAKVTWSRWAPI